jgi:hypothetical protein
MEFASTVALVFASSAVPAANAALPDADIAHVIQLAVPFMLAMLVFSIAFMLFLYEVLTGTAHRSRSRSRRKAALAQRAPDGEVKGI